MNWINVKDRLPESGKDVLVYWNDDIEEPLHQYAIVWYFKKGDVMNEKINYDLSPSKRVLDTIVNEKNQVKAKESGFYICEDWDFQDDTGGFRLHNDCITHWCELEPPSSTNNDSLMDVSFGVEKFSEGYLKGLEMFKKTIYEMGETTDKIFTDIQERIINFNGIKEYTFCSQCDTVIDLQGYDIPDRKLIEKLTLNDKEMIMCKQCVSKMLS